MNIILIRTVIMYLFVTIGIRLMGKRQIGDMQPNELVVTFLISEVATIPMQDAEQPVINGIAAIFVLVVIEIIISVLTMKSIRFRKIMNGQSKVIIKNGQIDEQAMKKVRMTAVDLIEMLRDRDVFDISTVAYAVLEVDGTLTVMLNPADQPATLKDIKIKAKKSAIQLPVITDGKFIEESISALGITKGDVNKRLKSKNISVDKIFLMTLDRYGNFNLIEKGKKI